MSVHRALAALCRASTYEAGRILPLEEVERRLSERRAATRTLGLAVPDHVRIIDPERDARRRAENGWGL